MIVYRNWACHVEYQPGDGYRVVRVSDGRQVDRFEASDKGRVRAIATADTVAGGVRK